jgi:hypothetical protein
MVVPVGPSLTMRAQRSADNSTGPSGSSTVACMLITEGYDAA